MREKSGTRDQKVNQEISSHGTQQAVQAKGIEGKKQMIFASGVVRPHPKTEALKWRILKTQTKKDRLFDVHELLEKFIDIL